MDEFRNRDSRLYVSSSKEAALDFVRNERRIELAAEGQRSCILQQGNESR